jgi:hypothetical protein
MTSVYIVETARQEMKQLQEDLPLVKNEFTRRSIEYFINQRKLYIASFDLENYTKKRKQEVNNEQKEKEIQITPGTMAHQTSRESETER